MKDRVFLDSNIIVYSYSNSEIVKQEIARNLISHNHTYISTQVLQEMCNTVTRKFKFSFEQAKDAIIECCKNNILYINTETTIIVACTIAAKFGFSFYDSLIVAAALDSGCQILFSEDIHDGQIIDGKLMINNPFRIL